MSKDIMDILSDYSPRRMSNGQIRMRCPFRENHKDGSGNFSMFLTPGINAYHCFGCEAKGNLYKMLTVKFSMTLSEAINFVSLEEEYKREHKEFELDIIWDFKNPPKDFLDRGFKKETLQHFRIGMMDDTIIIPFYRDFNKPIDLVGYQKRINYPDRRVANNPGFRKAEYLYNLDTSYEYVVLVEGYSDVMRLWEYGFNATALLGADISEWQVKQLTKFDRVYLALDNDLAGMTATERCYHHLRDQTKISLIPYPTKDPAECENAEWRRAFKNNTSYVVYTMEMEEHLEEYTEIRNKVKKEFNKRTFKN